MTGPEKWNPVHPATVTLTIEVEAHDINTVRNDAAGLATTLKHRYGHNVGRITVTHNREGAYARFGVCDTCGADAGEPCTVGQYGSPSPHGSGRPACQPHTRREVTS